MAFIPVPHTVEAFLRFNDGVVTFGIRLHFKNTTAWGAGEMISLANVLENWRQTSLRSLYANTIFAQLWNMRDLRNPAGLTIPVSIISNAAGTRTSPRLPLHAALVCSHRSGLTGRSFRGRTYWPGLTEDVVTNDSVSLATAGALNDAFAVMNDAVEVTGWQHVVVSKYANNQPRTEGITVPVSQYITNLILDTQRRRMPRGYSA